MSDLERALAVISISSAIFFYTFTIVVFLMARKNRVNYALAGQKLIWLAIMLAVALPAYSNWYEQAPSHFRAILWAALSPLSWWVMYEVYRANWHGSFTHFVQQLWCRITKLCKVDSNGQDQRG